MFGFLGTIDEAKIYNQALTSAEITLLTDFCQGNTEGSASDKLVAQLQLNETMGTLAKDSQGDNPGTLVNGTFFESVGGELGGGVTFDGNNDYIAVANSADINIDRRSGTQLWSHGGGIGLGGINGGTRFHSGIVNEIGINGFTGDIANLEIYNQALSQESIANLADLETPDNEVVVVPPVSEPQKFNADKDNFNYSGRVDWQNPQAPAFSYPGTAVEFKFTGTSLQIEFSEDNWGGENYIDVYIDGNPKPKTIKLQRQGGQPIVYDIAQGLENKVHDAVVVKRVDYLTGEFNFHSIIIDGQLLPAEPDSERTIEVYGDSISAARAVEYGGTGVRDPQGDLSAISNAYYSYASILARDYDAELSLVAQSGVPLIDGFGYWNNGTGTEAFYDKIKPLDNAPNWDFSNYTPDLVVISLGQNDASSIGLDKDLSNEAWKDRYKQFIANLRAKYPDSYFVGMFPNMYHNPQWDIYLTDAIAEYRQEYNDDRVFSLIHEQVTPGHPRISEQQLMADTLREFIDGTLTDNGFTWDVVK